MRFLLLFLFFASCTRTPPAKTLVSFEGTAMGIGYSITAVGPLNPTQRSNIEAIIDLTFQEINLVYNKWNPQSELSQLNQLKAYEKKKLSQPLALFLQRTGEIVHVTEGRFDPTIEPVQRIWKEALAQQSLPDTIALSEAKKAIGWHHIHIEGEVFYKDNSFISIDLGGIAKGYAVDLIAERLQELGFLDTIVEWGGEIRASGTHPVGRNWRISLPDFYQVPSVELNNQAIATSGDYVQQWQVGTETFFHILDPSTGDMQVQKDGKVMATTVLAENCTLADGIATALLLFDSKQEAEIFSIRVKKAYPLIEIMIAER